MNTSDFKLVKYLRHKDAQNITTLLGRYKDKVVVHKIFHFKSDKQAAFGEKRLKKLTTLRHHSLVKYDRVLLYDAHDVCLECEKMVGMKTIEEYIQELKKQQRRSQSGALISEKMIKTWLVEICRALEYLHNQKIYVHHQLHQENIFVSARRLKIGDYGMKEVYEMVKRGGSSSNILQDKPTTRQTFIDKRYDMWRLGLLLVKLMTGSTEETFDMTNFRSPEHDFSFVIQHFALIPENAYSAELIHLVQKLLSVNPSDRPYANEILQSQWLQDRRPSINERIASNKNVLTVSKKWIGSYYKSISAALSKASPDAIIYVRSGVYHENVVVEKQVHIVGEGACIIKGTVTLRAGVLFSKIIIENEKVAGSPALLIEAHKLKITKCDISSKARDSCGVRISGETSKPLLKNNHIHHCSRAGVEISNKAKPMLLKNDIHSNERFGIDVVEESNPVIHLNKIYGNKLSGICISEHSKGSIKKNEVFLNGQHGICITKLGKPTVLDNLIHDNQMHGMEISNHALGYIMNNRIFGNLSGIMITKTSNPHIEKNHIYSNSSCGILIVHRSKGKLFRNSIYKNDNNGIEISTNSVPVIFDNRIENNFGCGILVHQKGEGLIKKNEIFDNQLQAIAITTEGNPTIKKNVLRNVKTSGVLVYNGGLGKLEQNIIFLCSKNGVEIRKQSDVILQGNRISDCGGCGVTVYDNAKCTLHANEIYGNQFDNLEVHSGGKAILISNNHFHHSMSRGIHVHSKGIIDGYEEQSNVSENNSLKDRIDKPTPGKIVYRFDPSMVEMLLL